jgi:hypothetical protein
MQKPKIWLIVVLTLTLVCPALAQMGPGEGGPPVMGRGMGPRLYNPQTVTTVTGTVEKLEDVPMGRGGMGMTFRGVILKTDKGNLTIHLGPSWYLDEQKFAVKTGDKLEATGSQVTLNNQPALIAREVKVDGQTLKLRDEQGLPVWRGMGRRPGMGPGQGMGPGGGQGKGPGAM